MLLQEVKKHLCCRFGPRYLQRFIMNTSVKFLRLTKKMHLNTGIK